MSNSPFVEGLMVSIIFKKRLPADINPDHERLVRALVSGKLTQASLDGTDALLGVSAVINELIRTGQVAYNLTDERRNELLQLAHDIAVEISEAV